MNGGVFGAQSNICDGAFLQKQIKHSKLSSRITLALNMSNISDYLLQNGENMKTQ